MTGVLDAAIMLLLKGLAPLAIGAMAAAFATGDCEGALIALPGVGVLCIVTWRSRDRAVWRGHAKRRE